jgi:hypothetical protein
VAFLAPIFTAIGGFFAALGPLGQLALSFGLNLLAQALRKKPETGGELEFRTGTLPAELILGTRATTGVMLVPTVGWGRSNVNNERVYVLSAWRTNALKRVEFEGEWRTLTPVASSVPGVPEWQVDGIQGQVFVRYYQGHPDQAADPFLIANSDGDWKSTDYVAGCSYVVVRSIYNQEHMQSPAVLRMEVEGAPLYDPRKDTSVGGSGPHRANDWTTWEYSANPALMILALRLGLKWGDEMILGEGASLSEIPLADYALAANICDEITGGRKRYQAHMVVSMDDGKTLADVIQPLLVAMAGTYVPRVGGDTILAGAPRAVNHTINDEHVAWGMPVTFTKERPRINKFNVVSGTYASPSDFYNQVDYGERSIPNELINDGERLKTDLVFEAVTDRRQAQELADIYLRQNTFGASLTLTLGSYHQLIRPGDRIEYTTARWGGWTRTFIVTQARLLGPQEAHAIELTLEEDSNTVFSASTFDSGRPPIIVPANPQRQQELENFTAIAVQVQGSNSIRPGIRFAWTAINDPTVSGAVIQWKPASQPGWNNAASIQVDDDATFVAVTEGVVASTLFDVRTRILTSPKRTVNWSATVQVATLAEQRPPVDWEELDADIQATLIDLNDAADQALQWDITDLFNDLNTDMAGADTLHRVQVNLGRVQARFVDQVAVVVSANDALAARVTTVEAAIGSLGNASAIQSLSARVTQLEGGAAAVATFNTALRAELDWNDSTGKSGALLSLQSRVTAAEGTITSQGSLIAGLQSSLTTLNGTVTGQGTAILNLQTQVTEIDGEVNALATALIAIGAINSSFQNQALIQLTSTTNPAAGVWASVDFFVRSAVTGGDTVTSGLSLRVVGPANARVGQIVMDANKTLISSNGQTQALFDAAGVFIRSAYIGNLNASVITAGTFNGSIINVGTLNANRISDGTIELVKFAVNDLSRYATLELANTTIPTNSPSVTINNPRQNRVQFVFDFRIGSQTSANTSSGETTISLVRTNDNVVLGSFSVSGGISGGLMVFREDQRVLFDKDPPPGNATYRIQSSRANGGDSMVAAATCEISWIRP